MRLQRKIILSIVAHMCWLYIIVFSNYFNTVQQNLICDTLLKPYMKLLIYPFVVNFYVMLIYKFNPLDNSKERKIYIVLTILFTVVCWMYVYFAHNYMQEYKSFL